MFFYFIFTVQTFINQKVVVTRKNDADLHFFADKLSFRLRVIKDTSFKKHDPNVITIEPYAPGLYKIRFGLTKYLYKKMKDPGVILRIMKGEDIGTRDKDPGFAWAIHSSGKGYKFISRGLCLQALGYANNTESLYVNGQRCSQNPKQYFDITKAIIKGTRTAKKSARMTPFKSKKMQDFDDLKINVFMDEDKHKHSHRKHHHKESFIE